MNKRKVKRKVSANKIEYGKVTNEVKGIYRSWLQYSNIDESILLGYRIYKSFKIVKEVMWNGAFMVSLVNETNDAKDIIGEPFVSESADHNQNFMIDLSLLLLYIAERLDEANRNNPPIGFNSTDKEYFYNYVRDFVNKELV